MADWGRTVIADATDGGPVEQVRISGGGLTASLMSWGATLCDLRLGGQPLILGFPRFEPYLDHFGYFGAIVGRYANRIAGGRFQVDGTTCRTDRNFLGRHTLHGGAGGFDRRNWRLASAGADHATFTLVDPDGTMGFPGTGRFQASYSLPGDGRLALRLEGTTDRPSPVGLAGHAYFNLDGSDTILDHELRIDAACYLPVDDSLIPTGELRAVAGTPFDFRRPRPIRMAAGDGQFGYDHNFCLSTERMPMREVARLFGPRSGIAMTIATTEPGLQLYGGEGSATSAPGLAGRRYGAYAGLCLEPQSWPDAPNHAEFPSAILRPGETYLQETEYRFETMPR